VRIPAPTRPTRDRADGGAVLGAAELAEFAELVTLNVTDAEARRDRGRKRPRRPTTTMRFGRESASTARILRFRRECETTRELVTLRTYRPAKRKADTAFLMIGRLGQSGAFFSLILCILAALIRESISRLQSVKRDATLTRSFG
jgi:hypothetical protein